MAVEMAMLHDVARRSACRACMVACKQWHDLPADFSTPFKGQYQSHADLTSTTWNLIKMKERVDAGGRFHRDFIKFQCMHCAKPACMLGCPEGAISQKDSGRLSSTKINAPVAATAGLIVRSMSRELDPERNKSTKCDLCFDRIEHGMVPSCAKTCTADAIHFGTKAAMTQLAKERLKEVRMSHPNAQLYGVKPNGVGGTHMMYVLPEPPEVYGLPTDPKTPASIDLWRDYIRPLGKVACVGAVAGLAGVFVLSKILGNKGA